MRENGFLYPANPLNVASSVTQASPSFKTEVRGVLASIILFFIVYLVMFLLSIGLVVGCFYAGFFIITHITNILGILAGIGMVGLGIMVFIFLVKFLFAVSRFDRSNSIEITEAEQPALVGFIRQVAQDTQTTFPKKIYLSPDVNACVFYDSSFWSMFLPIKKNLQIGLGMVNAVNVSEFKAVLAHEFGHFSQRSMKLGSFVYNVNRIIHNMLFENNSYSGFLGSWASVSDVFALFASLTARIAQAIQLVLRKMYGLVNRRYMGLSREMEFHADAVAASISGSQSLITALRRIELADAGYNFTLQKCDGLFKEHKISENIYQIQLTVLKHLAHENKLTEENGLPVVTDEFMAANNTSRINFKDQWASHPATVDREKHLLQLSIKAEIINEPAWVLFREKERLQEELTGKIYEKAIADRKELSVMTVAEFESIMQHDFRQFSLPADYRGFYDNRLVELPAETEEDKMLEPLTHKTSFDEIFSHGNAALPKKIKSAETDLELVKAIGEQKIQVKTFDFDGRKYSNKEAGTLAEGLEQELNTLKEELKSLDKKAISFFLSQAAEKEMQGELILKYREYFRSRRMADHYLAHMNKMFESLAPIYAGQTIPIEQIKPIIATLKQDHEREWKRMLREWDAAGVFMNGLKEKIERFVKSDYVYFSGSSFLDNELTELNELCNASWEAVTGWLFNQFKSILETQLSHMSTKAVA